MADSTNSGLLLFAIRYKPSASLLPFEQVELFHVDRGSGPVEGDDDRKPDGDLRSRHRQREKDEHLATKILKVVGERDKINVGRVQHEFHREQNGDDIAPYEHAHDACQEDDGAQNEIVGDWNGHWSVVIGHSSLDRRGSRHSSND